MNSDILRRLGIAGIGVFASIAITTALFLHPIESPRETWFQISLFVLSVGIPIWMVALSFGNYRT